MTEGASQPANDRGRRCAECGKRFSLLNLGANLILAVVKGLVGLMAGSQALVAAALYSINDSLSAVIAMISISVAGKPADREHAYGYGKAEYVAIGIMALALGASVLAMLVFSLIRIFKGGHEAPHFIAAGVAGLSLVTNWFLSKRGFCAARFLGSPALYTTAEHNRTDSISSLVVLIGVGGATLGVPMLDPLIALFEVVHVAWLAGSLLGKSIKGLTDAAAPRSTVDQILNVCEEVEGVERVVELRTRAVGSHVWADVLVAVPEGCTVRQASAICDLVRESLPREGRIPILAQVGFRPVDPDQSAVRGEVG